MTGTRVAGDAPGRGRSHGAEPPAAIAALARTRLATTAAALDAALETLVSVAEDEEVLVAAVPSGRRLPEIRLTPGLDFPDATTVRDLARRTKDQARRTRIGDRAFTAYATGAAGDVVVLAATGSVGRSAIEHWAPLVAIPVLRTCVASRERRRSEQMDRLNATTSRVAGSLDLDEVLGEIVRDAVELLGADSGDMLLLEDDRRVLRVAAVANFPPEMLGFEMGPDEGVSARAMRARRTIIVDDYERYRYRVRRLDAYRFRSVLCAPLVVRDEPIGALNVHATDAARRFDKEDAALLSAFATHAAIAIDNARRFGNELHLAEDLARANDALERSLTLQSRLAAQVLLDAGPAGVTTELARLLDRDVVLHDALLGVIAGASPDDGAEWERLAMTRGDPADEAVLAELAATGLPTRLGDDADGRLVAPVRVGMDLAGFLVLPAPEPLSPLDRALVEVAVTGVALELAKVRAQAEIEQRLRGDVVTDLVTGGFTSPASIASRAARLGLDLHVPHDVLVVGAAQQDGGSETELRRRVFEAVQAALRSWSPSSMVARVGDGTVVLASQGDTRRGGFGGRDPSTIAEDLHARLAEHVAAAAISVGVGERCEEPAAYAASFELAAGALDAMGKLRPGGAVVDGRRLGVARILISAGDPEELRAFARRTLGTLLDAGRHELLDTLRAYVEAGFNQREAARRSFVHFNTVAYRLRRTQELLGVDLNDPNTRLDVTLALQVAALDRPAAV